MKTTSVDSPRSGRSVSAGVACRSCSTGSISSTSPVETSRPTSSTSPGRWGRAGVRDRGLRDPGGHDRSEPVSSRPAPGRAPRGRSAVLVHRVGDLGRAIGELQGAAFRLPRGLRCRTARARSWSAPDLSGGRSTSSPDPMPRVACEAGETSERAAACAGRRPARGADLVLHADRARSSPDGMQGDRPTAPPR